MKLRVTLCAAVLFSEVAAFAQPQPWLFGPYDKLQPYRVRTQPFLNPEPVRPKGGGAVIFVPAEKSTPVKALPQTNPSGSSNHLKSAPLKSNPH
jgi:hypothetical protein